MTKPKKKAKPKVKKLTEQEKEQRLQVREISVLLKNIGFTKLPYIDGRNFTYAGRASEMDDIYINENIILITEYTVGHPKDHLLSKNYFYQKVYDDKRAFLDFLLSEEKLKSFKQYYNENIDGKYSKNEIQLKILYCSKQDVSEEHKQLVNADIIFFDYHIVKYFESLTKVIKKSSKYEFLDFLGISFSHFGSNLKVSSNTGSHNFSGHILPEEKSSFKEGYKIISFYIDASSLLKRSYVLRQNGWREKDNIGHYQRMLVSTKISGMRRYLTDKKRVFINNIITSIATDKIKLYDKDKNELKVDANGQFVNSSLVSVVPASIDINDETNIIGLIDGQHRTFAYHEGDDVYESEISKIRGIQNLLVTGILFPHSETNAKKMIFEANLFLEINSNQSNATSQLKQEIELMINPLSPVAISKKVLEGLNKSGPLNKLIEQYWYEKDKLKTASIVSYGLKPLLKIEDVKSKDSIFSLWQEAEKNKLKAKDNEEHELLQLYINFSVEKIRDLLRAFKDVLVNDKWNSPNKLHPDGILTVTFVNGVLNTLRLLIENGKVDSVEVYKQKLKDLNLFPFKDYKSSGYRKMGEDLYSRYFK